MRRPKRALQSGGLAAANQVVGAGVTAVAAILLSKALGPEEFAIYALCTSFTGVLRILSRLGINACLLSQRDEPQEADYRTAGAITFASALVVAVAGVSLLPLLGRFSRIPSLFWPAAAAAALLPLHVLALPAMTQLERRLQFRPIVAIELAGQVISQTVAITLAFNGWHIWGPVVGWVVRAVLTAVAPWVYLGVAPRFGFDGSRALRMVRFGFGYVLTASVVQGRSVVLLAVVGRLLGQEAVGLMGLTVRAAGLVAPVRAAVSRVILPALAPIADSPRALRRWLSVVVETELLIGIPGMVAAVAVYGPCVHLALGPSWQATIVLFPWAVAGALLTSVHAPALSALHLRAFFAESIASSLVGHVALAVCLVPLCKLWGLEGCAAALVVAWPAAWMQEWFAARRLGTRWSRNGIAWALGGAAACLVGRLGPAALLVPVVTCLLTWRGLRLRFSTLLSVMFASVLERRTPDTGIGRRVP